MDEAPAHMLTGSWDYQRGWQPPSMSEFGVPVFTTLDTDPCTTSDSGRCVGRPDGYRNGEYCTITVENGGGTIAPCRVYDFGDSDHLIINGVDEYRPRDDGPNQGNDRIYCPEGLAVVASDSIIWRTEGGSNGNYGPTHGGFQENGCTAAGTCGLPYAEFDELGGGWELCFDR